jgi:carbonic anhydrase
MNLAITQAESRGQIETAQILFREYAEWLGVDLRFQGFEEELACLPGKYAPPQGRLYLGVLGEDTVGCVALRPFVEGICEMKRLFIRESWRQRGAGKHLAEAVIAAAREIGYRSMVLDTLAHMSPAITLYRSLGFREIPAYYDNPIPGATYFELQL